MSQRIHEAQGLWCISISLFPLTLPTKGHACEVCSHFMIAYTFRNVGHDSMPVTLALSAPVFNVQR
jgi:hypothetical protein